MQLTGKVRFVESMKISYYAATIDSPVHIIMHIKLESMILLQARCSQPVRSNRILCKKCIVLSCEHNCPSGVCAVERAARMTLKYVTSEKGCSDATLDKQGFQPM
jgi:hypothetical protein